MGIENSNRYIAAKECYEKLTLDWKMSASRSFSFLKYFAASRRKRNKFEVFA